MDAESAAGWERNNRLLPPSNRALSPCEDCTVRFAVEMRLAGRCDGWPEDRFDGRPWSRRGVDKSLAADRTRPRYSTVTSQPKIEGAL